MAQLWIDRTKNPVKTLGYGPYWILLDIEMVGRGLPNTICNLLYYKGYYDWSLLRCPQSCPRDYLVSFSIQNKTLGPQI